MKHNQVNGLVIFLFLIIHQSNIAQLTFQKTYGDSYGEHGRKVIRTSDGCYVIAGSTNSINSRVWNFYLLKTNTFGEIIWDKVYSGSNDVESAVSIQETSDNGFIIGGDTRNYGNIQSYDIALIKTDSTGNIEWSKTLGGVNADMAYSVQETLENGFVIIGYTTSFGENYSNIYLIKTDNAGNVLWSKTYDTGNAESGHAMLQTKDGGLVIAGKSNGIGTILFKTDIDGNVQWANIYPSIAEPSDVIQCLDGGYIIGGNLGWDIFLIKTDSIGSVDWAKAYGGTDQDVGHSVRQTQDSGYIIAGQTDNFGAVRDGYAIKTDNNGNLLWSNIYGGDGWENFRSVIVADDGFLFAGWIGSFGTGGYDIWLVKTDSNGNSGCNQISAETTVTNLEIFENPITLETDTGFEESDLILSTNSLNTIETVLCTTTNINTSEVHSSGILLYPNPVTEVATLKFEYNTDEVYELRIYNTNGQIVHQEKDITSGEIEIKRSNLDVGLYFIRLQSANKVIGSWKAILK